jgi:hypothetical protein
MDTVHNILMVKPRDPGCRLSAEMLLPSWYRRFAALAQHNQELAQRPQEDIIKETNLLASILRHGARHGLSEEAPAIISACLSPLYITIKDQELSFIQHWRDIQDCVRCMNILR